MSTTQHPLTLSDLEAVIRQLRTIDHDRAELIILRDEIIRELRQTTSAPRIGKVTGLSTTGIYKIQRREGDTHGND